MPATRSCRDLSVTPQQSKISFSCRKSSRGNCTKKITQEQQKKKLSQAKNNENRSPLKSPQKQHNSVSKSPLQDRTNIQSTPNNLVKRKLQSDDKENRSPLKSPRRDKNVKSPATSCQQTKLNFSNRKLSYVNDKENRSPLKSPRRDKNVKSPATSCQQTKLNFSNRKLSYVNDSRYSSVREALHRSMPQQLVSREEEIKAIQKFIDKTVIQAKSGSMYISGAPGTGKTACLMKIIEQCKECKKSQFVFVNCMSLKLSQNIFTKLAQELSNNTKALSIKESMKLLEKKFTASGERILLILDEVDQLESKNQEVLYKLFEMPFLPKSRLVLIGIANALDLTDRILPRLQAKSKCKPVLLQFPPYTKEEVFLILKERIKESKSDIIDENAIQFCARKVSAMSGDVRKALDIMRRAVECVEVQSQKQSLQTKDFSANNKVTVASIASVCNEVYGSKVATPTGSKIGFPLQQKIVICTLMVLFKDKKIKEVSRSKLYESYCRICKSRQIGSVSQEEVNSACILLESQGIIALKKGKDLTGDKISLRLQEAELEHALQDKTLITSILKNGIPS